MWAASLSTESNFRCLVQICQSYKLNTCIISSHRDQVVCRVIDFTIHFHNYKAVKSILPKNNLQLFWLFFFLLHWGTLAYFSNAWLRRNQWCRFQLHTHILYVYLNTLCTNLRCLFFFHNQMSTSFICFVICWEYLTSMTLNDDLQKKKKDLFYSACNNCSIICAWNLNRHDCVWLSAWDLHKKNTLYNINHSESPLLPLHKAISRLADPKAIWSTAFWVSFRSC